MIIIVLAGCLCLLRRIAPPSSPWPSFAAGLPSFVAVLVAADGSVPVGAETDRAGKAEVGKDPVEV